jgi:hypothetical protein
VRSLAVFAIAIAALFALAHTPIGGRALARPPVPSSAAFSVPGSNGFRIDVGSERGKVTVLASEQRPPVATVSPGGRPRPADPGNGAANLYYARGSGTDPTEIDADLGRLGTISVAFRPSGKTAVTVMRSGSGQGGCAPTRIVRRLGTFTGTIRFRGEEGYTAVETTRARGSIGTPLPRACPPQGEAGASRLARSPWPEPGTAVLAAVDKRAGTSFEAVTTDSGVAFRATLEEHLESGVVVVRRAYAGAPPSTFAFNRALSWARVKPPAPFSGVARFDSTGRRGTAWKGNLRATFPGVNVPMAGPSFRASLGPGR